MTYGARAVDSPDAFVGRATLSKSEFYPVLTGTAYSSHAPASWFFHPVNLPTPLAVSNVNVFKSLNVSVPAATSAASTGSEGYSYSHGLSVYQRQDYAGNSTNLSCLGTASVGLSASLGYSSTSQQFGMTWVTNTTGGTSTFSTTSNSGNWSNYASGPFVLQMPYVTALTAGEYWFAHAHSSTAATSNSAVTLLSVSNLHVAPQLVTFAVLGGSATVNSGQMGMGLGVASTAVSASTLAGSVVSAATVNLWVQNLSNA